MHPSIRCCSARAHTPLIKFLGKRTHPNAPAPRHPHPAAPAELQKQFPQFLTRLNSSESSGSASSSSSQSTTSQSGTAVYTQFWEAPPRFWKPRVRELNEAEMDAIMSGGASSY